MSRFFTKSSALLSLPCMTPRLAAALWCFFLVPAYVAAGQEIGVPGRETGAFRDTLDAHSEQPFILRPFIIPGSEQVLLNEALLDSSQYQINFRDGRLWLYETLPDTSASLVVVYRTFPFQFKEVYRRRGITSGAASDTSETIALVEEAPRPPGALDPFGNAKLQRSGSITRGILAGNNRDVSVESGLRMQLSGEIVEGVNVQAVLTDENTPIQPEGTTQRLSEFDRVFIGIQTRRGEAQLGDFDLTFSGTEFARFSRKLQGASVQGDLPDIPGAFFGGGRVTVAGAAARGIFHTQEIEPIDGVQGPYRLEGKGGEQFIIVVAGSETVYLNGRLLTRGETNDYVIDYQTGEITFTPQRLVTDDLRILVEFQYTASEFTRTLVGSQAQAGFWQRENGISRVAIGATFLREADSRQFNAELGLTSSDSLLLVEVGDGPAFRSGAEPVRFDSEAPFVQYTREPFTTPDGRVDTIFVALSEAPADTTPVYRVRFARAGPGQGSYARVGRAVNGILYEYRGPGQGEYDPVRLIPKPKQQRLLDLHAGIEPVDGLQLFGEWGRSLNDQNRLSDRDFDDDQGDAYLAGLRLKSLAVSVGGIDLGRFSAEVSRRYTGAYFESFDRIRPVEFGRKWNLVSRRISATDGVVQGGDETVDEAFAQLDLTPRSSIRGEAGRIALGSAFQGDRRSGLVRIVEPVWPQLDYQIEYVQSTDTLVGQMGTWLRQLGVLQRPLLGNRLAPRLEFEQEHRRQRQLGTDSLARESFSFVEYRPGLSWVAGQLEAGVSAEWRTERDWFKGSLQDAATAWTIQTRFKYRTGNVFNTDATAGYRVKRYERAFRVEQRRENSESVVIQWNSRASPLRRAVDASWFYEALTERTPTLQEIYVRTGPEFSEAQYVWEDENGDGIIQVDEFLPERTPNEGAYARTFVPSDSLTSVISVQARLRVGLEPARLWEQADTWLKRALGQVNMRTTLEVLEKSRESDLARIYLLQVSRFRNPFTTLNGRLRIGQEIYLFRTEPRYGIDLSFNQLRGLTELASGEETRFLNTWRMESRVRPSTQWGTRVITSVERNRTSSEAFSSRRYDIQSVSAQPEISFNPSRALQFTSAVSYARKTDAVGNRTARLWKFPLEGRYMQIRKLQMTVRGEMARVQVEGDAVGLARFELTDGRGPGTSFLWGINGQYTLNQYLRASFSYDGRAPSGAPILHTVRVQLSALF